FHRGHGRRIEGAESTQQLEVAGSRHHQGDGRRTDRIERTQELANVAPQQHPGHGCGAEGVEGTQALANAGHRQYQGNGCRAERIERTQELAEAGPCQQRNAPRAEGTEGIQELTVAAPRRPQAQGQGHGSSDKGIQGSTAWTPDFSLIPRLWECDDRTAHHQLWPLCRRSPPQPDRRGRGLLPGRRSSRGGPGSRSPPRYAGERETDHWNCLSVDVDKFVQVQHHLAQPRQSPAIAVRTGPESLLLAFEVTQGKRLLLLRWATGECQSEQALDMRPRRALALAKQPVGQCKRLLVHEVAVEQEQRLRGDGRRGAGGRWRVGTGEVERVQQRHAERALDEDVNAAPRLFLVTRFVP